MGISPDVIVINDKFDLLFYDGLGDEDAVDRFSFIFLEF